MRDWSTMTPSDFRMPHGLREVPVLRRADINSLWREVASARQAQGDRKGAAQARRNARCNLKRPYHQYDRRYI